MEKTVFCTFLRRKVPKVATGQEGMARQRDAAPKPSTNSDNSRLPDWTFYYIVANFMLVSDGYSGRIEQARCHTRIGCNLRLPFFRRGGLTSLINFSFVGMNMCNTTYIRPSILKFTYLVRIQKKSV